MRWFDAILKQLAKELKKFQYSTVEKGKTRRRFGGSVQWLIYSSMVNTCYNIFITDFNPDVAYKLIANRNGRVGVKETLLHYMVMYI